MARLDSADEIAALVPVLVQDWRAGKAALPLPLAVANASRRGRSQGLVALLEQVA